jgi:hypothetical protein
MGLWPRALAVAVAVVVVALVLKFAHPLVVLVVFVAGIAIVSVTARRRVREPDRRAGTELLGLKRETTDPFGILAYPLALFGRAADPRIDDLVWGRWRAIDVHSFALSFEPPSLAGQQTGRATLACAMAKIDDALPGLVVEPQTFLTLIQSVPPGTVVEVGDRAFDTEMNVWSEQEAFAHQVLDAPARDWLRSLDQRWGVEVRGQIAMVYGPKPDRPDLIATLEILRDLVDRLPKDQGATQPPAG